MPAVAAGAAIAAAGSAAAGAAAGLTTAAIISNAMIAAALSAAAGGIGMLLAPKAKRGLQGSTTATLRNPTAYRKGIYGRRRVGGVMVFIDTRNGKNGLLDMVIAVAGHEIEGFDEMWFGDNLAWDKDNGPVEFLQGHMPLLEFHTGVPGDPASPGLLEKNELWSADHKLEGIAYVALTLGHSVDKFPGGIPNISFVVRGKNTIEDPRDGSVGYTNNAALCIRDFLIDQGLGLGTPVAEIDEASFIAGANLSDESVDLAEGGSQARYLCDGVFDANTQFGSIIESLLSSMGARLTYTSGKFRLVNPVFEAPTLTLDESHLRGPVNVATRRSRRDAFNVVSGLFASAVDNFTATDYPPAVSALFELADGEELFKDLPLPFTTSAAMAQRLAKVELLRGRRQISAQLPVNLAAMVLSPGDKVAVSIDRFGWAAKNFEVESWSFSVVADGALGIELNLVETSEDVFDWTTSDQLPHVAGAPTNLPDGFTITAPGLSVSEEERTINEDLFTVLIIDVSSSDAFTESFEVEIKLAGDTIWRAAGRASTGRYEVVKVTEGELYDVRARVRSVTSIFSDYTQVTYAVTGSLLPPPDVTGLVASAAGPQTTLEWTPSADLRLSHYIVRHTPKVVSVTWATATTIVPKVARPASSVTLASRAGTYLVKAVDKLGRVSSNAATIVSPVAATEGLNVVELITESPLYPGVKTGTEVSGVNLALAGTVLFDSVSGNFDAKAGLFDEAGEPFVASGIYDFASVFDLGAVYTSRVFAALTFDATGGVNLFDSQAGNFDAALGLFDAHGAGEAPGLSAFVEMSTTPDDPGGSPVWSAWAQLGVAEVEARAFRFRAQLASDDDDATPLVTALSVTVDMPDRIVSGVDIQSGTDAGGLVVVLAGGAFKAIPAIGITAQDMVQGDFFEIVTKSVSGFTVRFKSSGDTVVDRTFDYDVAGYGRAIA